MKPQSDPQFHAQHGSVIIAAMVFLVVVAAAAAGISHLTFSSAMVSTERVDSERAFYAAESARLMQNNTMTRNLASDLHGLKNPNGTNLPDKANLCNSGDLYIGWVGEDSNDWNESSARHAICAGGGGAGDPSSYDNEYFPPTRISGNDEISGSAYFHGDPPLSSAQISGNVSINGFAYFEDDARLSGRVSLKEGAYFEDGAQLSGNVDLGGDGCFEDDARLSGNVDLGGNGCFGEGTR